MVYFVNLPFFLLFTMGAGLAQNIETLVICRMFSGIFGGPALAVSAGSFVDVWELKSSGLAVSVQAIATFMGPALGKLCTPHPSLLGLGETCRCSGWRLTI
jgi:MFS family permease